MTADRLVTILVTITVVEMMIAVGLGVRHAELVATARNGRQLAKAALANYVCVPVVTVGLLLLFHPVDPLVPIGFLILAVCPGAPFGPACVKLAKGNVAASVGLMVMLAGSSALIAPVLLYLLVPLLAGGTSLHVDSAKIVVTLLVTQLAPLCLGLGIRQWLPALASRLLKPANLLSALLNLTTFGLVLVVYFPQMAEIRLRGYLGMSVLLAASCAAGWMLGGPGSGNRKALMLTTSLRNVGVGLVIATGNFAETAAVTAVLVYGIFEILASLALAVACGRTDRQATDSPPAFATSNSIPRVP